MIFKNFLLWQLSNIHSKENEKEKRTPICPSPRLQQLSIFYHSYFFYAHVFLKYFKANPRYRTIPQWLACKYFSMFLQQIRAFSWHNHNTIIKFYLFVSKDLSAQICSKQDPNMGHTLSTYLLGLRPIGRISSCMEKWGLITQSLCEHPRFPSPRGFRVASPQPEKGATIQAPIRPLFCSPLRGRGIGTSEWGEEGRGKKTREMPCN